MSIRRAILAVAIASSGLASPVYAEPGDFRTGTFDEVRWCDYDAILDIESQEPGTSIFHGYILIVETNEYDRIWIEQYPDKSLRMIRSISAGPVFGRTQTVQTRPPISRPARPYQGRFGRQGFPYFEWQGDQNYGFGCAGVTYVYVPDLPAAAPAPGPGGVGAAQQDPPAALIDPQRPPLDALVLPNTLPAQPPAPPAPPPPMVAAAPAPAPGIDFTGTWQTQATTGNSFRMSLLQDASGLVSGSYTPSNGKILAGAVVGNQLLAYWEQAGATGRLTFTMAPGGGAFEGNFTVGDRPVDPAAADGGWDGTREVATAPPPSPPAAPGAGGQATTVAIVTTDANVRAGKSRTTASYGVVGAGTSVPVVNCADGWCLVAVPGMPSGYIADFLLRFGNAPPAGGGAPAGPSGPPAGGGAASPPPTPPVVAAPSFAGRWATVTGTGGQFSMVLTQIGPAVTGTYSPQNGTIAGAVEPGGRLVYRWSQDGGLTGMGVFQLSADGRSMSGTFGNTNSPLDVSGSWFGTRQ